LEEIMNPSFTKTPAIPHGLHHVTAIADNPQANVDFYSRALGLRLVKQTVNFDAPHVWHLYYGDEQGSPASLLTFFPWPGVVPGREGAGLTTATGFSVPPESIGWWHERLKRLGLNVEKPVRRGDEDLLTVFDSDGMRIELIGAEGDNRSGWDGVSDIPSDHAVRGLHSVTLSQQQLDATSAMLTELLGMQLAGESAGAARFSMGEGQSGALIDVAAGVSERGLQAGGTVHHVAFRAPDLPTLESWRENLVNRGVGVTQIMDRQYFKSIYFREPGGVLFEIATDDPGFAIDEPLLELGKSLRLPPWLEPSREQIANMLPKIEV
jgi:glyoxalase family protein